MLFSITKKKADRIEAGFSLNKRAKGAENTTENIFLAFFSMFPCILMSVLGLENKLF